MKNRFTLVLGMLLSAVVLLALPLSSANAQTYCTPSNSSSTGGIGIVMTQNGLTNFNNSSGFTSGGYAAYLDDSVTVMQGNSFTLQAQSNGSSSYYWSVWVDWNDDGDFDDQNEQVYVNNNSTSTSVTATIYVSYAVSAGRKRMRVIGGNTSITDACMSSTSIEGEDYTLRVTAAPACSGQPTAGGIASSPIYTICPNLSFSLTDTGATGASNMTYQWQERNPAGTGTWTDIPGAINFNLDFPNGITSSTDYRFYVVCNNSNQSDTSNVVQVSINSPTDCYCTPDFSNNSPSYFGYAYLSEVQTTGGSVNINNTSSYNNIGYEDFRNTDTLKAMGGDVITLSPTIGTTYSYTPSAGLMAWIDWNHDGDFDDPGEVVNNVLNQQVTNNYDGTFQVPITAALGHTTLRVMTYYYEENFDPCGTSITSIYGFGEAEDYTVIVDSMPGCASATFPSSIEALVNMDTLCVSGDITLDLDTAFFFSSVTYQWQESPTGTGNWTDVGTPQIATTKTITGVNSDTWYRCKVLCNGNTEITSSIIHIHINDPQMTSAPQGGTRCGPGTVGLTGSVSTGSTISWYESATGGGLPFATGTSVQSPYIVQTDTFWAAPSSGTTPDTAWIGDGTSTTTSQPTPFYTFYMGDKLQVLITASELQAAGLTAGFISSIGFDVLGVTTTNDLTDFTIKMGQTTANDLTTTWETGLTTVYTNPAYTVQANTVNSFALTTPIPWDGVSNIVIETCFNNTSYSGNVTIRYTTGLSFQASHYSYEDNNTTFCNTGGTYSYTTTSRPNVQIGMLIPCEGGREPVVAVVTPGPPFEISYDSVICNNTLRPINVTSPLSNYTDGYTWTIVDSVGELFTDAAGTTPYVSGTSANTVYFRTTVSGLHRIAVHASNGPAQSDCAAADTADIWVQPGNIEIRAIPDTICISGSTDLTLMPDSNYALGSIQWQESGDGTNYNNIPGATSINYTTVNLSTAHYYRAVVSAVAGVCETPDVHMVIANPILVNTLDSFHCGPGSVTLSATSGQNTTVRWYEESDGGSPLHIGNTFNTPVLTQADTFYAAAGVGSPSDSAWIGDGTSTSSGNPNPFYTTYMGNKVQMLVTAAELQAAGFTAGYINSIGFEVLSATTTLDLTNFNIKIGETSAANLTTTWETGLTTVYTNPAYTVQANSVNSFTLSNPFPWDGVSNLVIETCFENNGWNGSQTIRYTSGLGFNASHYNYEDNNPNHCSNPTGYDYTATSRPNILFDMGSGCESPRVPVIASIYPKPEVDLGADINECVDSGTALALDAGVQQYNPQFLWDNNTTSQVRSINQSGVYYVTVTNSYTCKDTDTIDVVLRNNPDVDLGGDTTVCENTSVMLDAGDDGIQYFWNTGDNSQTITVNTPGTYNVLVTNDEGCTDGDTVTVDMSGQLPHYDGIMVTNNGVDSFTFNPLNPQGVVGYEWDMGDGTPHKFGPVVHHKYNQSGTYIVTLFATSECGSYSDSTSAHILGIGDLNLDNNQLAVYPNPTKDKATIVTKGVKMEKIAVYNVLGQKIYEAKADNPYEHKLDLSGVASGVYNIRVYTESGMATRKLNVLK